MSAVLLVLYATAAAANLAAGRNGGIGWNVAAALFAFSAGIQTVALIRGGL